MRVILGDHARQRFHLRGGTGKLSAARVERSLCHTLRMGAVYTNEAVRARIDAHLDAVCVPLSGAEGGRVGLRNNRAEEGMQESGVIWRRSV